MAIWWAQQQVWARDWWINGRYLAPTHRTYWRGAAHWLALWWLVRLGIVLTGWSYILAECNRARRAAWRRCQAHERALEARRQAQGAATRASWAAAYTPTVQVTVHARMRRR